MSKVRNPELIDERMSTKSRENLKVIRFEGQLLPDWAQLLYLAARVCPVAPDASLWFARLTSCSGAEDARTVIKQCGRLRTGIQKHREAICAELERSRDDGQSEQILAAWKYSLDTMIQEARSKKTCSWIVEAAEDAPVNGPADGDAALKRA
jgi:hypothetical protein